MTWKAGQWLLGLPDHSVQDSNSQSWSRDMPPTISILLTEKFPEKRVVQKGEGLEFRDSVTEGICFTADFLKECWA